MRTRVWTRTRTKLSQKRNKQATRIDGKGEKRNLKIQLREKQSKGGGREGEMEDRERYSERSKNKES